MISNNNMDYNNYGKSNQYCFFFKYFFQNKSVGGVGEVEGVASAEETKYLSLEESISFYETHILEIRDKINQIDDALKTGQLDQETVVKYLDYKKQYKLNEDTCNTYISAIRNQLQYTNQPTHYQSSFQQPSFYHQYTQINFANNTKKMKKKEERKKKEKKRKEKMKMKQQKIRERAPTGTSMDPIYVNAKQYNRIIKRRAARQRLQKLIDQSKEQEKNKKYLYESRHKHAVKRKRGPGGQFLSKKNQPI